MIEFFYRTVLSGAGATSLLDLWALFLQRFFRVPAPNWGLVGRWFCPLTKARVIHDDITPAHPYPFARVVGWIGHYAIGIVYAGALLALADTGSRTRRRHHHPWAGWFLPLALMYVSSTCHLPVTARLRASKRVRSSGEYRTTHL